MSEVLELDFQHNAIRCVLGHLPKNKLSDVILLQFTGLKDKNEKQIYESDLICVLDAIDRPYIVHAKWDEDNASWHRARDYRYGEVIGNIYENPELLGGSVEKAEDQKS